MTSPPLVSVIILTYNREDLLKETLRSILSQTHEHLEILVIDNFSEYDIETSLKEFNDQRIVIHRHENGGLLAVNRNLGVSKAKGEFIAFCDDDDLWQPEKITMQLKAFSMRPENLVVGTNYEQFPRRRRNGLYMFSDRNLGFLQLASARTGIPLSSSLTRKEVFDTIGHFDEDPDILTMEDLDFWLRVLKHKDYSIHVLSAPLLKYRVHEANMFAEVNSKQSPYGKLIRIFAKHSEQLEPLIASISSRHEYLDRLHVISSHYYNRSISVTDLFWAKDISLKDKISLTFKRAISDFF